FQAAKLSDSGKVYMAMAAPGAESGCRWTDDLNSTTVENIEKMFAQRNSGNIVCSVPIDPTRQISASDLKKTDTLWQKIRAGGPVMLPLLIVAVLATILIIERLIFIIPRGRNSVTLAETILAHCHQSDFNKAQDVASKSRVPIAKVLNACLLRRNTTAQLMEDAIQEAILHEMPRLERFLPTIGILAGIAPLLGLLGTVTGMISTFDMITQLGTGQPRLMAGGISEALLTTATGLIIAIPVLLMHSYLSSRSDRIIADTERYAATVFNLIRDSHHEKMPVKE
ncbi:MAG: MotA/TolQ/ExbB proton channel family protein, partial [Planctomycetes bacterium]|nr:MotA/TolQ/ExbB proton channel family protein [Planctomycetota bacterium]